MVKEKKRKVTKGQTDSLPLEVEDSPLQSFWDQGSAKIAEMTVHKVGYSGNDGFNCLLLGLTRHQFGGDQKDLREFLQKYARNNNLWTVFQAPRFNLLYLEKSEWDKTVKDLYEAEIDYYDGEVMELDERTMAPNTVLPVFATAFRMRVVLYYMEEEKVKVYSTTVFDGTGDVLVVTDDEGMKRFIFDGGQTIGLVLKGRHFDYLVSLPPE